MSSNDGSTPAGPQAKIRELKHQLKATLTWAGTAEVRAKNAENLADRAENAFAMSNKELLRMDNENEKLKATAAQQDYDLKQLHRQNLDVAFNRADDNAGIGRGVAVDGNAH
jgi:hypothetical protein